MQRTNQRALNATTPRYQIERRIRSSKCQGKPIQAKFHVVGTQARVVSGVVQIRIMLLNNSTT